MLSTVSKILKTVDKHGSAKKKSVFVKRSFIQDPAVKFRFALYWSKHWRRDVASWRDQCPETDQYSLEVNTD